MRKIPELWFKSQWLIVSTLLFDAGNNHARVNRGLGIVQPQELSHYFLFHYLFIYLFIYSFIYCYCVSWCFLSNSVLRLNLDLILRLSSELNCMLSRKERSPPGPGKYLYMHWIWSYIQFTTFCNLLLINQLICDSNEINSKVVHLHAGWGK